MLGDLETRSYKGCYLIEKGNQIQVLSAAAFGKEVYLADTIAEAKSWIEKHDSITEQKKIAIHRARISASETS